VSKLEAALAPVLRSIRLADKQARDAAHKRNKRAIEGACVLSNDIDTCVSFGGNKYAHRLFLDYVM